MLGKKLGEVAIEQNTGSTGILPVPLNKQAGPSFAKASGFAKATP
jgi:hypothetical protein